MALQNRTRSSRRPTGGRPGERSNFRVRFADRRRPGLVIETLPFGEVFRRPIESTQYLAIRYTERLAAAGIDASVGSRGDSYDNALAESVIGLFMTEVIRRQGPWRSLDDVEFATLAWVHWFNTTRLLEPLGYLPPAEFEAQHYSPARTNEMQPAA
jgi:hypothetical protein